MQNAMGRMVIVTSEPVENSRLRRHRDSNRTHEPRQTTPRPLSRLLAHQHHKIHISSRRTPPLADPAFPRHSSASGRDFNYLRGLAGCPTLAWADPLLIGTPHSSEKGTRLRDWPRRQLPPGTVAGCSTPAWADPLLTGTRRKRISQPRLSPAHPWPVPNTLPDQSARAPWSPPCWARSRMPESHAPPSDTASGVRGCVPERRADKISTPRRQDVPPRRTSIARPDPVLTLEP